MEESSAILHLLLSISLPVSHIPYLDSGLIRNDAQALYGGRASLTERLQEGLTPYPEATESAVLPGAAALGGTP